MLYFLVALLAVVFIITLVSLIHLEISGKRIKTRIILICALILELIIAAWFYGAILAFEYEFTRTIGQAINPAVSMNDVCNMGRSDANVIRNITNCLAEDKDKKALMDLLHKLLEKQQHFFSINGLFVHYNIDEHIAQYNIVANKIQDISSADIHACHDVDRLAKAINSIYPIYHVWEINGKRISKECGLNLLFDPGNPSEITVPKFKIVLEADSHTLLSCYGRIISPSKNGYIVGTVIGNPTNGKIIIFDNNFQKVAEIDSQKVVKIKLVNLLDADTLQIMTWEDHHHGTNTTRRVLNIYMADSNKSVKKIFEHDLIDATFSPGGPHGVNKEIYYRIATQSLMKKKQIIAIREDSGDKEVYNWNGVIYKSDKSE
ncbi:MAG: hypothetical protein WCV67_17470 [Victivallaceae bacterium]|jgi:hypothetical protein